MEFCKVAFHYVRDPARPPILQFDLTALQPYMCEVTDQLYAAELDGLSASAQFNKKTYEIGVFSLEVGASWPVGAELVLKSLAERPGSIVVSLRTPIGGRREEDFGIQFAEYAVCDFHSVSKFLLEECLVVVLACSG